MSHIVLNVAFKDTAADQLQVAIGQAIPPTLGEIVVEHPHGAIPPLTLGILGGSHVVFVGTREEPQFVEEVSCTAARGESIASPTCPISVQVVDLDSETFVRRIEDLQRELEGLDKQLLGARNPEVPVGVVSQSIIAEFPGAPGAITALSAEAIDGGYRWRTWHGYPPGQLVITANEWTTTSGDRVNDLVGCVNGQPVGREGSD